MEGKLLTLFLVWVSFDSPKQVLQLLIEIHTGPSILSGLTVSSLLKDYVNILFPRSVNAASHFLGGLCLQFAMLSQPLAHRSGFVGSCIVLCITGGNLGLFLIFRREDPLYTYKHVPKLDQDFPVEFI